MTSWQERIAPLLHAVEKRYDALKYRLYYALGGPGPIRIAAYRGYGNAQRLYMKGRVLEERGIVPPREGNTAWDNLKNMLKRLDSREVPHARVLARSGGVEVEVQADEEGMFEVHIEPARLPETDGPWHPIELELLAPRSRHQRGPVRAEGQVLVPPPTAGLGVISDIDDTVIHTDATDLLRSARTVLFGSARTRMALPGVAALYRALHAGPSGGAGNPLFYVSNGPWNLYDVLGEVFVLQDIPTGPLLLRNWGLYEDELLPTDQRAHKFGLIRPILETYPHLPFLLIGDSGEADAEIYRHLVHEHPGRIAAVYIRNVEPGSVQPAIEALAGEVAAAGSALILARDSLAMARHAARQGWISEEQVATVRAEMEEDAEDAGGSS